MAADEKWYFAKEQLQDTPSRKCGFDADKELSYRQQAANFIQDMGQKLQVSQLCINTAIVYMHRFYMFHSFTHFPWNTIAAASFFLAAKVEEQPRKLEHVIRVANLCLHRDQGTAFDAKSEQYAAQSQDLVFNENVLLQTLGFDVAIDHPHTHVVRCCHLVRASKDLAQTSYFMASNSLHLTTMCLQYKPTVVACFCIHLACKWSNWQIPKSNEGKDWFYYVDKSVTSELLEQLTTEFLVIFDKCPSRLKRKILSISTTTPHTGLEQSHPPNSSSPFDTEPRKTQPSDKDGLSFHARMHHEPKQGLPTVSDDLHKKSTQRPHDPSSSQQRVEYRDYREKKERERLEREKAQHHAKPGVPPVNKHLPMGAQPGKAPHGHHRPPIGVDPKLKMHHRPSGSREQMVDAVRDPNAHGSRESLPVAANREYTTKEATNGREGLNPHPQRDHREVHRDFSNKEVQKHNIRPDVNKIDGDLMKVDSVDKQRFDSNRSKVVDPKLLAKHDPNRHKYPNKRPETVQTVPNSDVNNKKLVSGQNVQESKNSFINKQANSTSQRHKSPFSDAPKSVPLLSTPVTYAQKTETRNGNHSAATSMPIDKQAWPEATMPEDPSLLSPPTKRIPSLFSPEKTTPPKKLWNTKTPPSSGKRTTDTPQLPNSSVPAPISPFASPPPKLTPAMLKRHRTSSSGSEPELRPVVKKLDQISGFENIIRDSKMGIKLPKVPDIIQPICDRTIELPTEASISKELKPPDIIKPFNTSGSEIIPLSQPLVNGIETDPTLISNLLKEVTAPPISHLPVMDSTKSPVPAAPQLMAALPATAEVEKHKSEHHHKSEKKKKKDKHKHKDKDKNKDEKKKKHKDKDKEKHKIKTEKNEDGEAPLKITIAMDKIQPPPESSGLKVKISKDRLKTDSIENTGSLKIKISKDALQYTSVQQTDSTRKRDREKSSPLTGPSAKQMKMGYNRNQDLRQNGRNSYSKVVLPGDGDASQLRLAESKYHSKGASKAS